MTRAKKNSVYFEPSAPASFSGLNTFKREYGSDTSFLFKSPTYTLHKPTRRRFKRNRVIVSGFDSQWQLDLSDLTRLSRHNDGYRYLLCCIDVLSKYASVVPLKNKTGETLVKAMTEIFKSSNRQPTTIQSDQGTEFVNNVFLKFLKKRGIHFFTTFNEETKASIVERFQRTLKGKMWRYFTHNNTHRYIDVVQDLVHSYNHTYHRSIKTKPALVTRANAQHVWDVLYGDLPTVPPPLQYKFQVNDRVRVTAHRLQFRKGYESGWTEEIFEIHKRIDRTLPVYVLRDLEGEVLKGTFYEPELQKVEMLDNVFIVEKVLKTRQRRKQPREYFVRWRGYPSKFDSWVTDLHHV